MGMNGVSNRRATVYVRSSIGEKLENTTDVVHRWCDKENNRVWQQTNVLTTSKHRHMSAGYGVKVRCAIANLGQIQDGQSRVEDSVVNRVEKNGEAEKMGMR